MLGNHDVGDVRDARQRVTAERLSLWQHYFGSDRWVEDVGGITSGWCLIGLDAMPIGSGEPEEDQQALRLEEVIAEAGARQIAWFLHRPLFLEDPDEDDTGYCSVKPQPRGALLALVWRHRVALVSGKRCEISPLRGRALVARIKLFRAGVQPKMPGEKRLGAVRYEFGNPTFTAEIAEVPGLKGYCSWVDIPARRRDGGSAFPKY